MENFVITSYSIHYTKLYEVGAIQSALCDIGSQAIPTFWGAAAGPDETAEPLFFCFPWQRGKQLRNLEVRNSDSRHYFIICNSYNFV